jgi:hypothetical protein
MPRFHLHLTGLRAIGLDEEGAEFESLEHAYLETFRSAQEMWHELLLRRDDPRQCAFEITDGAGTPLMTVPLTEVLDACRRGDPELRLGRPAAPTAEPPPRRQAVSACVAAAAAAVAHATRVKRQSAELAEQLQKTRSNIESAWELIRQSERVQSNLRRPADPDARPRAPRA